MAQVRTSQCGLAHEQLDKQVAPLCFFFRRTPTVNARGARRIRRMPAWINRRHIGIADGVSIARVRAAPVPKMTASPRRNGRAVGDADVTPI